MPVPSVSTTLDLTAPVSGPSARSEPTAGHGVDRVGARVRRWLVQGLAGMTAVLGLAVLSPAPAAGAACTYGGTQYCPATIEGVAATRYGTGSRVWLDQAFVTAVTTTRVTVAQKRVVSSPCTPGSYCGQGFTITFVHLDVPWRDGRRPTYGTQMRLYGTTTTGTLVPTGFVATGTCTTELVEMELC